MFQLLFQNTVGKWVIYAKLTTTENKEFLILEVLYLSVIDTQCVATTSPKHCCKWVVLKVVVYLTASGSKVKVQSTFDTAFHKILNVIGDI